jgi:hypothetical protein
MSIDLQTATTEQLKRALELRQQIDALQADLRRLEDGPAAPAPSITPAKRGRPKGKRYFSPEARQKMADAQRRRWAAKRASRAPGKSGAQPKGKGKRIMTDEWRAKIAAAQKARWAKKRGEAAPAKEEKPAEKPAAKKKVNPKLLANLAKARAVRLANLRAAKGK